MAEVQDNWQRLSQIARSRRHALGIQQDEAVQRGQTIKIASWRKLEAGVPANYAARVIAGFERGLQWEAGSVAAILRGDDPTPLPHDSQRFVDPSLPSSPSRRQTESATRALEEIDSWFNRLLEKIHALSWASRERVDQFVDELLTDEAQARLHARRQGFDSEGNPAGAGSRDRRDPEDEVALAAAGKVDLDPDTRAALERAVRQELPPEEPDPPER